MAALVLSRKFVVVLAKLNFLISYLQVVKLSGVLLISILLRQVE